MTKDEEARPRRGSQGWKEGEGTSVDRGGRGRRGGGDFPLVRKRKKATNSRREAATRLHICSQKAKVCFVKSHQHFLQLFLILLNIYAKLALCLFFILGGRGVWTFTPKAESALPFAQLWDEEEDEEKVTNLRMTVSTELTVAEDLVVTMEDIFRHLQPEGHQTDIASLGVAEGEGVEPEATMGEEVTVDKGQ